MMQVKIGNKVHVSSEEIISIKFTDNEIKDVKNFKNKADILNCFPTGTKIKEVEEFSKILVEQNKKLADLMKENKLLREQLPKDVIPFKKLKKDNGEA